jgi:hypothetical protein
VDLQPRVDLPHDLAGEPQELLVPMPGCALGYDFAGSGVQGRKELRRIFSRFDKLDVMFTAFIQFARIV